MLFIPKPKRETITLKAPNENADVGNEAALSDWEDTPTTIKMRENLEIINENMLRHWYDLYIADETYDLLLKEIAQRRRRSKTEEERQKKNPSICPIEHSGEYLIVTHLKWVDGFMGDGGKIFQVPTAV